VFKTSLVVGAFVLSLVLLAAPKAKADNVQFNCLGSGCTGGSVTQIGSQSPNFNFVYQPNATLSGDWEIAVLVPNGSASLTVNSTTATPTFEGSTAFSSGKLGDALSSEEAFGPNSYTFDSLQSASAQALVTKPNSFTAYEYDFGTHSSSGKGQPGISGITVSGAPTGSVIVGWVEVDDSLQTPLSGSITVPEAPEPVLLGIGLGALLLCAGLFRQRLA
jgi:hypothetical protein